MNASGFVRVRDLLDSGRAMIFMRGLTEEKQNIPVDPDETFRSRAVLE